MHDRPLYPPIEPYDVLSLDVGDDHHLHVESCGNPVGRPVVFLHGGPGAGCTPQHRRLFDPDVFRIILFDQRGAGRSRPLGHLVANTTAHLIADTERVRERLNIDSWIVFGGSWGSTLATLYAARHSTRVAGLILRGTWLGRAEDVAWLASGLRRLAPEPWRLFAEHIPEGERGDLIAAYTRRLSSSDVLIAGAAARAWCAYERSCATLLPNHAATGRSNPAELAMARIEAHFFRNQCFLDDGAVLAAARSLGEIPGIIVHGRYDLLAPLEGGFLLAAAWPAADFQVVDDAGHSAFEPTIRARLIAATDRFATSPG